MASFLPRCLDSLLAAGVNDKIEAIVVNDGSNDNSLSVAKAYQRKYPDCIVVIDKPNGNYGSTINSALPVAKGKYVKILDADDWFNSINLVKFIGELESTDADMAVTHFKIIPVDFYKYWQKHKTRMPEWFEKFNHVVDIVVKRVYIWIFR